MGDFVELGLTGLDGVTNKYFDKTYDKVKGNRSQTGSDRNMNGGRRNDRVYDSESDDSYDERVQRRRARDERDDRGPRQRDSTRGDVPRSMEAQQPYQPQYQPQYQPYRPYNRESYDQLPQPSSREHTAPYAAAGAANGAVAPYNRERNRERERSRSRRRRRSRSRDDRRYSDSRSRSRSRDFESNPLDAFDRSGAGLGAGLAGALVGGWLGREASDRHQDRGTALGAIIGGIGANLIENRVKIYREEKKEEQREREEAWRAKHGQGRKRRESPMRYRRD